MEDYLKKLKKAKAKEERKRKAYEKSLRAEGAKKERKKRSSKNKKIARKVWRKLI